MSSLEIPANVFEANVAATRPEPLTWQAGL
jgi:hypothetical protein